MIMSRVIYFFYISALIFLSSCVPASDDSFDEVGIDNIPLKTGNKWIYDITRGGESFTDSAEILDYFPYQVDELTNKYLYQYKDIAYTFEMSEFTYDTVFVKLIEYDGDKLFQYGSEKRDRSGFIYGEPVIFSTPEVMLDHSDNAVVEELYISSLLLNENGYSRTVNDTIVNCVKINHVLSSGSFITTDLNYNLNFYYTELGVLKIEGIVNNSAFSATAVSCTLK